MDCSQYTYSGKVWRRSPTADEGDSFFHSAFGTTDGDDGPYRDKCAKPRRTNWSTFLMYYNFEDLTGGLLARLRKCFMANERHRSKCIKTTQDYRDYINMISGSNHCVLVEEIPVLASLENVKIILFTDNCDEPEVFEPDSMLLRNFPSKSTSEVKEAVICLVDKHFSRMESTEPTSSNLKKNYPKLGSAGIKGSLYQIKLLTMVLVNGLWKFKNWRLSTENKQAAQLDDLVFEHLPSGYTILLQAKHKEDEKKKVTYTDLMSLNNKNLEFSLPKYFFSYQAVKTKFNVQNVVICTNLKLDEETKKILKEERVDLDSVLRFEGAENICYGFSGCSLPELKQNIKTYHTKYVKTEEVIFSDEDVDDFLKHLKFFCFDDKIVDKVIDQAISHVEFSKNLNRKVVQNDILKKMTEWFQEKKGRYLTEVEAKAFFCDNRSNKYCEDLKSYNVSFKSNNLPLILQTWQKEEENGGKSGQPKDSDRTTHITHIIPDKEYILNVVKIYQALPIHHREKALFVNPDETVEIQKEIIAAFQVQHYSILIMVCPNTIEDAIAREMCGKVTETLNSHKYKHVILIAEERNNLVTELKNANTSDYEVIFDNLTFGDLEETTQEELKLKRIINFQGTTMSLKELCIPSSEDDLNQIVNSEMITKLARGRGSKVGLELPHPDNYYISRSFNRKDQNISEEDLWRSTEASEEKIILISDSAGMGKSSVLTSLAISIKRHNPHLWVVRLNLNNYTNILMVTLEAGRKSVSIMDMLNSQETSKLNSEFEKKLFTTPNRVVLMLDGVDEISPTYTELVINLIKDSLTQVNLVQTFVTTRPHILKVFENISKVQSITLEPFSECNQIDFLMKYWTESLDIQDVRKSKCKLYAEALIRKMSVWINEDKNNFAGIPLQTRMLAEIFGEKNEICHEEYDWEGCKEFVSSNSEEPNLPTRIDITQLYKFFIDKKCDIFIKKSNPSRDLAADEALKLQLEKCHKFHRAMALKVVLDSDNMLQFFTCFADIKWPIPSTFANNLFRVGIVQNQGKRNAEFIHRTFAEYFVAQSLLVELERKPLNEVFQEFFMRSLMMDKEFYVVRAFVDNLMRNVSHSMENNFCSYFRRNRIAKRSLSLYFTVFAEEGCARILKCLIKCIDIEQREILSKTVNRYGLMGGALYSAIHWGHLNTLKLLLELNETFNKGKDAHKEFLRWAVVYAYDSKLETLNFLLRQVDKSGKNILGRTALHEAASMGRIAEVESLIEEAETDINIKDSIRGWTALHEAVFTGRLAVVKFMVEQAGADINIQDNDGKTPLHIAACGGDLEIVKFLVDEAGADINIKNTKGETTLHTAAYEGNLEIVKFLVEEAGVSVNFKNIKGETALHRAACNAYGGALEIVKFLVKAEACVNIEDNDGKTALHRAAYVGDIETVKFLVERTGANINITDNDGETALHKAISGDEFEIVKFLVEGAGADINIKNDDGKTALHKAAYEGKLEMVKLLVKQTRADITIKDDDGETALHTAAHEGKLETVKFLVEETGADIHTKDNQGRTALRVAANQGHWKVVKFLSNSNRWVMFKMKSIQLFSGKF